MRWNITKSGGEDGADVGIDITNTDLTAADLYLPPRTLKPGDYVITAKVTLTCI